MEGLSTLEVIIAVIIGMSIFELLYFLLSYFIKEKEEVEKDYQHYKDYINSISTASAVDPNKED